MTQSISGKCIFPPVGQCVYCGDKNEPLKTEHIIPLALNGELELPRASCGTCEKETHAFEGKCCARIFNPIRLALNYPSRRKKKRAKEFPNSYVDRSGNIRTENLGLDKHTYGLALPKFDTFPSALIGDYSDNLVSVSVWRRGPSEEKVRKTADEIGAKAIAVANIPIFQFARLLAKIGHCFGVASLGMNGFKPFLTPLILNESRLWTPYIGSSFTEASGDGRHKVKLEIVKSETKSLVVVTIHLFNALGAPGYQVVIGELADQT